MFVLPVSGAPVIFHAPNGRDDLMLSEGRSDAQIPVGVRLRVDLVRRLARPASTGLDWDTLPYVDVDAALLGLRQYLSGDRILAEIQCRACGSWGDVELSIGEYLNANRPRISRSSARRSTGEALRRIPTVAQVLAAINNHGQVARAAHAIETDTLSGCSPEEARQMRAAIEKAAPPLAGPVEGACPQCGAGIAGWFDPGAFVISELRRRASTIVEEVHLLASRYGWTEDTILDLPAQRRSAYGDLIVAEGRAAR